MYFDSIDDNKKSAVIRIVLVGVFSFIAIVFLTIKSVIPSIEKDLLNRVSLALYENKINNILVTVSGQNIILEGLVSEQVQTKAVKTVSQVRGVGNITSEFILVSSLPKSGKTR